MSRSKKSTQYKKVITIGSSAGRLKALQDFIKHIQENSGLVFVVQNLSSALQMRLNLPIDIFFNSLAEEREKDAIGIIVSGTGSDRTMGTRAIKEVSGMIMAQDETSAKFPGMPSSSITTWFVDYIFRPNKMPAELLNYIKHRFIKKNNPSEIEQLNNLITQIKVKFILKDHTGIDFLYYKGNVISRYG